MSRRETVLTIIRAKVAWIGLNTVIDLICRRPCREQALHVRLDLFRDMIRNRTRYSGAEEIQKKHAAGPVGIIPSFVLDRVIEDEALALLPGSRLTGDAKTAAGRHDQRQMQPIHARGPAAVGFNMGAWPESGKPGHR